MRTEYVDARDLARLDEFASFDWLEIDLESEWHRPPPYDARAEAALAEFALDLDALIVCHGSPRITGSLLSMTPRLRLVGELEGDRLARRIDVSACTTRGVVAVDTTQGSSYPVSEWALALMMIGLRDAGALYRRIINHEDVPSGDTRPDLPFYRRGRTRGQDREPARLWAHRPAPDRVPAAVQDRGAGARPLHPDRDRRRDGLRAGRPGGGF